MLIQSKELMGEFHDCQCLPYDFKLAWGVIIKSIYDNDDVFVWEFSRQGTSKKAYTNRKKDRKRRGEV